jgi:hypothetical protein
MDGTSNSTVAYFLLEPDHGSFFLYKVSFEENLELHILEPLSIQFPAPQAPFEIQSYLCPSCFCFSLPLGIRLKRHHLIRSILSTSAFGKETIQSSNPPAQFRSFSKCPDPIVRSTNFPSILEALHLLLD